MFDYLQQFNSLPKELRDKVSSPAAMAALMVLENKYAVDLAMTVMKVMTKSLAVKNLPSYFISDLGLSPDQAQTLTKEIKEKILAPVAEYLGLSAEIKAFDLDKDIALLIKEAGLVLPSNDLVIRLKNILAIYLKGVRSKIDTRATLAKDIASGGLNLSTTEVDRLLQVCDQTIFKSLEVVTPVLAPKTVPSSRLEQIITSSEAGKAGSKIAEYSLKQAISSGQIKKPTPLDTSHEISAPLPEKDLPLPEKKSETVKPVVAPVTPVAPMPAKPTTTPPPIIKPTITPTPIIKPVTAPIAPTPTTAKPITPTPPAPSISRLAPAPSSGRTQMHDIKPMPKVMGPVEELQFLDVVNFRRLGKTPAEATAKIFAKIKLLEEDGYDKMVLGVKAWRKSLVNRLYLALVREAVNKGVALQEELAARQKINPESLSWDEVQAILALNSKLVF